MSKELTIQEQSETTSIAKLGSIFVQSGFFKDLRDQAQAVVKILYGRELGFSPVASVMGIHVIEGKPSLSSNLMGALVKRSGRYDYRVNEWTEKACELTFMQLIGGKWEISGPSRFTIEDAQRAGVMRAGGSWTKYPKAMLLARALSAGVKAYCPDVSACPLYTPEELGAQVNEEGEVTELPKSARQVEVTTEPVTFTKPQGLGVEHNANSGSTGTETRAEGPSSAPKKDRQQEDRPPGATSTTVKGAVTVPHAAGNDECIDMNHRKALHRQFKEALMEPLQKSAGVLLQAWLAHEGYYEEIAGIRKGTTSRIPKVLFDEVKAAACKYAVECK